jgi:signal transduction histidine kinase
MGLRAPVIVKLLGAHLLAIVATLTALRVSGGSEWPAMHVVVAVIAATTVVFLLLSLVALMPLRALEAVASRIWRGDFGARVEHSMVADRNLGRIGEVVNILLDGLTSDRRRMHALATAVIEAGDRERATLARELHDSTAQQLAALMFQLGAAHRDCKDSQLAERLEQMQELAREALEEVRLLAHTVHPRVLDDLGLVAALRKLAREGAAAGELEIEVVAGEDGAVVPATQAAVLYRVAQASVHNVLKHAGAQRVELRLDVDDRNATLAVVDDGRGFSLAEAEKRRPGMGLFTMRERVSLAGGQFDVTSAPGAGTRIMATVPLDVAAVAGSNGEDEGTHER